MRPHLNNFLVFRPIMLAFALAAIIACVANSKAFTPRHAKAQRAASTASLVTGAGVERRIAGGESHDYDLAAREGQGVFVLVEQRGIDLALELYAPGGERLIRSDTPNGTAGPERLFFIVPSGGTYRVRVVATAGAEAAGYSISLEQQREATPQDRLRVSAQAEFLAALALRKEQKEQATRRGIERLRESARLWGEAGDKFGEGWALLQAGLYRYFLGETEAALAEYRRALPVCREAGDRNGEAVALDRIATASVYLGDVAASLEYFGRALELRRAVGDRQGEAVTLTGLGNVQASVGETQKAFDLLFRALDLRRAVGDRAGEAYTLTTIATTYSLVGEWPKALDHYGAALRLRVELGDRRGQARTLNGMGGVYAASGNTAKAVECFESALPLSREYGDPYAEADALAGTAEVLTVTGEPRKALAPLARVLAVRRGLNDSQGVAATLAAIGVANATLGEAGAAREALREALPLSRRVGDRNGEANVLYRLARVERDAGDLAQSRLHAEEAIAVVESLRASVTNPKLRASYFATARRAYEFYIDLLVRLSSSRPGEGLEVAALRASERARARSLLEMIAEARADVRADAPAELVARDKRLRLLVESKTDTRIRLLAGGRGPEDVAPLTEEIARLEAEYQQVETEIMRASPRYAALADSHTLGLEEIRSRLLDDETVLLEYSLGDERSYVWAVTTRDVMVRELPARREVERAALEFYQTLLDARPEEEGEGASARSGRVQRARQSLPASAAALGRMLLGPVASLVGSKRLLVVKDGALQYVPFGALQEPGAGAGQYSPLLVSREVSSAPSASVLALQMRLNDGRARAPRSVAVVADPVFERDDPRIRSAEARGSARAPAQAPPTVSRISVTRGGELRIPRLPFTRGEAEAVAASAGRGALLALDFRASKRTVEDGAFGDFRIIHFATHGVLDGEHPELSGIVLSLYDEQGRPQSGLLGLPEIYRLKLNADLVVLSACQSALGKEVRGEGLDGLTRGFMYAGASRVVASLWKVDDAATAELMKHFYRAMLTEGKSPAAALRSAQLAVRGKKRWSDPYYWAAFVLQGDWK
ncbi:MAG: CHAT domain-containing protein [Rubrivivax sp.]|nr:CHAT domain-containing protein [Pyrinomonadaceae bacterium]